MRDIFVEFLVKGGWLSLMSLARLLQDSRSLSSVSDSFSVAAGSIWFINWLFPSCLQVAKSESGRKRANFPPPNTIHVAAVRPSFRPHCCRITTLIIPFLPLRHAVTLVKALLSVCWGTIFSNANDDFHLVYRVTHLLAD